MNNSKRVITPTQWLNDNDGGAGYADVETGLVYSADDETCTKPIGKHNGDGTWRFLEQAEQAEFARLERAARAAAHRLPSRPLLDLVVHVLLASMIPYLILCIVARSTSSYRCAYGTRARADWS
eukprot:COSAG05_NODE_8378_length_708_cov_4.878489_1_plen_124_part_00